MSTPTTNSRAVTDIAYFKARLNNETDMGQRAYLFKRIAMLETAEAIYRETRLVEKTE